VPDGQVAGHCMKSVAEKGCVGARRADCWCQKGRWQVTEIRV
jgi:hypothetical protein